MSDIDFGKQLRTFRQQCHNPRNGKTLSQQRLGELLGEELGAGFSGAAVSDWERGESKIHVDDRLVLISLLKVLNKTGGLKTLLEANTLLEAGNYRALNLVEQGQLFHETPQETYLQSPTANPVERTAYFKFLLSSSFFNSPEELDKLLNEANEGPPPAWPRIAVSLLRRVTDQISILNVLRVLIWIWIWLLTYMLIMPSLQWPFATQEQATLALVLYSGGSLILPLLIGALINTKNITFWQEHKIANSLITRLYVHQGAFIGFHLGYFIVFAIGLIRHYFNLQSAGWLELITMAIPLVISHTAAQLTPYNLWHAYRRLHLKDGGIFFVFVILGPLWGWFFFEFYSLLTSPLTGIFVILAATTLLISLMTWQYRRKGNTVIPIHWWIIFYGIILICQVVSLFIK